MRFANNAYSITNQCFGTSWTSRYDVTCIIQIYIYLTSFLTLHFFIRKRYGFTLLLINISFLILDIICLSHAIFLILTLPDSESFESAAEEQEFLTMLYNSIKSFNFYCSKCTTCVNVLIQNALKLEDDEISHEDEEVPENCYQVLHKFLSSRGLCCSSCKSYIRMVTIRPAKTLERSSIIAQLVQTSTASTPSNGIEN